MCACDNARLNVILHPFFQNTQQDTPYIAYLEEYFTDNSYAFNVTNEIVSQKELRKKELIQTV